MGHAGLGRELGDAGGPLLVGAIGTAAGIGVLAAVTVAASGATAVGLREPAGRG